jgi:hypothetical protein
VAFADPAELGNLGHAVLESFDFHNSRDIPARVRQSLERLGAESEPLHGLETRVSRAAEFLCRKLAGTPPTDVIREMPFCARFEHDGAICVVDGKIDLLYLADGIWHIVDYKFVNASAENLAAGYALQLQIYHDAISEPAADRKRRPLFVADSPPTAFAMLLLGVGNHRLVPVPVEPIPDTAARVIAAARLLTREIRAPSGIHPAGPQPAPPQIADTPIISPNGKKKD